MERGATVKLWQETNGYWSASVDVKIPGQSDWYASATTLHNADDALEWARLQIHMAVDHAS